MRVIIRGLPNWQKRAITFLLAVVVCMLAFPRITRGGPEADPKLCLRVYSYRPKGPCIQLGDGGDYRNYWINTVWSWNGVLGIWHQYRGGLGGQSNPAELPFLEDGPPANFREELTLMKIYSAEAPYGDYSYYNQPSFGLLIIELIGFTLLFAWLISRI